MTEGGRVTITETHDLLQPPDKTEPVLADKEVVMSALNIKSMSFDGGDIVKLRDDIAIMGEDDPEPNMVNLLLDLSFATNVRYLDEQEIYLSDNIELTKGRVHLEILCPSIIKYTFPLQNLPPNSRKSGKILARPILIFLVNSIENIVPFFFIFYVKFTLLKTHTNARGCLNKQLPQDITIRLWYSHGQRCA